MKLDRVVLRRVSLALLGAALLLALAFVVMRSGPLAPTRVTVHSVQNASLAPALFGIGTVEARRVYPIGPTAPGRVLRLLVDVGERVTAGQLLAEMDPVDLNERAAALDAAIARAGSVSTAAAAQRQDALAKKALADITLKRQVALAAQDFISASALEASQQAQNSASANASAAEASLAAAQQDTQRLLAERAGLKRQDQTLRLLAPADAVVISRSAEPGSAVVAGQALLKLVDPASLWVSVRFDQGRSAGLAPGLQASIALRSNPAQLLAGQVVRLEALSDSVTEERVAQVSFQQLPAQLSLGELAEVTVSLAPTTPALLVPNASLKRQAGVQGVWLAEGEGLRFAPVVLGQSGLDGSVQVLQGLQAGDPVVVHSEKELSAASRIQVVQRLVDRQP